MEFKNKKQGANKPADLGAWIVYGLIFGTLLGIVIDKLVLGMILGICGGIIIGSLKSLKAK